MIKTAYRWEANWKITLLFVVLLPLLMRLGFWQLSRADEKRVLEQQLIARQAMPALVWEALVDQPVDTLAHRRVQLTGEFDSQRVYLLDNQVFNAAVGYQVLQVFHVDVAASGAKGAVLINRGWVEGFADRRLPDIALPEGPGSVVASVYIPSSAPLLLAEDTWKKEWPKVIQAVDMDKIRAETAIDMFPFELRLEANQWGALGIDWPVVNTRPEKHLGYAVQWFAMSAALVIAWLFASIRKAN